MDFRILGRMFAVLLVAASIHLYQSYRYDEARRAEGCVRMGKHEETTEIVKGVTVTDVVWFCDHREKVSAR